MCSIKPSFDHSSNFEQSTLQVTLAPVLWSLVPPFSQHWGPNGLARLLHVCIPPKEVFVSAPIPNVCHQILITSLCHHKDCLMMCMQHVETLLASHFLHNRHQKASASPSGCLPSLKMPIKSAIRIFPPVLECIVAPLIVCAYSKMSHCHFGVT